MEFGFAEKVTILGTDYSIEVKKSGDDVKFTGPHEMAYGVVDYAHKRIVIRDRSTDPGCKEIDEFSIMSRTKKTLRHEITHAFLHESGLDEQTRSNGSWARNEEIIDWIALQGPKFTKAWTEAGAL